MLAVIVENDESTWGDQTGLLYHFPKRYKALLVEGTDVIYYKGRMKDRKYSSSRMSEKPHYFGVAKVGRVFLDAASQKGDLFATIASFAKFEEPVMARQDSGYIEVIPPNKVKNFWRDAVRSIGREEFDEILTHAELLPSTYVGGLESNAIELKTWVEGGRTVYIGTKYERDLTLRRRAIEIHGEACNVCGFDFGTAYGQHGEGFIHVHHVTPISAFGGERVVNPETDLITLCANCHAAAHRQSDSVLSVQELKKLLRVQWVLKK
jgi:5-methylcytosine-specific restriction protein A